MNILRSEALGNGRDSLHIDISDSGLATVGQEWQYKGMCSPFSRLYYILGGEGRIRLPSGLLRLHPGQVYLIPAELTFDYACDTHMRQLYFHINTLPLSGRELFSGYSRCLSHPAAPGEADALVALYLSHTLLDGLRLRNHVHTAMAHFLELAGLAGEPLDADSPFAAGVYAAVRRSLSARLTVGDVARMLSMSESALVKRFRLETGMTLGRYIDGLLMQEARRRLIAGDGSIGQIAEALDFCDQFYFCRYFKQRQGETPSQYRRMRAQRM